MVSKVKFEVIAGLYIDFLNFLIDSDIIVSGMNSTEFGFTAVCFAKDYRKIARLARKYQCRTCIIYKKGLWFKARKLLSRKGLLAGAAVIFLNIFLFTHLVWRIDVITPDKNITQDVYTMLYNNGMYVGAYFSQEKNQALIQKISKEVDNVAYITMNFYKGILTCKVDPTINKLPYLENQTTGNITASLGGIIEELEIYNGFSDKKIGQSVLKGDVLVSATFIDRNSNLQQVMPRAYIKAYCEKTYTASVPFEKTVLVRTGEFYDTVVYKFLDKEFEIKTADKQMYTYADREKRYENVNILGFRLPATKVTVRCYQKEAVEINRDENAARIAAKRIVNTIIAGDNSLIEAENTEYTFSTDQTGVTVVCTVQGHYDITK